MSIVKKIGRGLLNGVMFLLSGGKYGQFVEGKVCPKCHSKRIALNKYCCKECYNKYFA